MRPESDTFLIKSLKHKGERDIVTSSVEMLGDYNIVSSERDNMGLLIKLDSKPLSDKPVCFKIGMG